jgi:glutamate-1-semialdehyde aminotransferase
LVLYNDLAALEAAFAQDGARIAGFMLEPIQVR